MRYTDRLTEYSETARVEGSGPGAGMPAVAADPVEGIRRDATPTLRPLPGGRRDRQTFPPKGGPEYAMPSGKRNAVSQGERQPGTWARAATADLDIEDRRRVLAAVAGGIVHDFNNALAAITGHVSLARQSLGLDLEATSEDLEAALAACTRARKLVDNLLAYLRETQPAPRMLDFASVTRAAVTAIQEMVGSRAMFTLECSAPSLPVTGDPDGLFQVVANLCLNAVEANEAGEARIRVRLEATETDTAARAMMPRRRQRWVQLEIQDNGKGIPASQQRKVFDPLFTSKPATSGAGLGLAIVKRIVCDHGGTVRLASEPGEGTTLTVRLPRA